MLRTGIRAGQRLVVLAVTGLAAAAVLTGCSADAKQASTELPPAASTSAEPTPELPPLGPADLPMPAEARTRDAAGAEEFLRYYIDVYNHAQRTMDSTYMRQFSRDCETCDRIANDLDTDAASGYMYEGGNTRIDDLSPPAMNRQEAQFALATTQAPLSVVDQGRPVSGLTFPERSSPNSGAMLEWDASQETWLMTRWDVQ